MNRKRVVLITVTAMLWLAGCADAPEQEQVAKPEPTQPSKQQPQQQPAPAPEKGTSPSPNAPAAGDSWIDYTPRYLWAYSSQFHEGFENITDPDRIAEAVTIINAAPLVTEMQKQPNWGLLQFATGDMQLHYDKDEHKLYLLFGGQIKQTDRRLLQVLGIEELMAR